MVDKPKLDQMLSNLREYVRVLRELAATPREAFLSNPDKMGNTKYHFVIAIECGIDIANHIIASENFRFPKDNADSFIVLGERGVLDQAFTDSLRGMARFRNRLVHFLTHVSRLSTSCPDALQNSSGRFSLAGVFRGAQSPSRDED